MKIRKPKSLRHAARLCGVAGLLAMPLTFATQSGVFLLKADYGGNFEEAGITQVLLQTRCLNIHRGTPVLGLFESRATVLSGNSEVTIPLHCEVDDYSVDPHDLMPIGVKLSVVANGRWVDCGDRSLETFGWSHTGDIVAFSSAERRCDWGVE